MWRTTVLLACTALTACLVFPVPSKDDMTRRAAEIKPGETSKQQVIDRLGSPDISNYPLGSFHYYGRDIPYKSCGGFLIPAGYDSTVYASCVTRRRQSPWWVQIRFDNKDLVQSIETKKDDAATQGYRAVRLPYLHNKIAGGDREAAAALAREFNELGPLRKLAEQGNAESALVLAKDFHEMQPLRKLADRGDVQAALVLAKDFKDTVPLRRLADDEDRATALTLEDVYEVYSAIKDDHRQLEAAWYWLCQAANGGYPEARIEVAQWHRTLHWENSKYWTESFKQALQVIGVHPDDRIAYMWLMLAASDSAMLDSVRYLYNKSLEKTLSEVDIENAKQMALDWKPGQCPSKEHPLTN